jgi:hypothetical protein
MKELVLQNWDYHEQSGCFRGRRDKLINFVVRVLFIKANFYFIPLFHFFYSKRINYFQQITVAFKSLCLIFNVG